MSQKTFRPFHIFQKALKRFLKVIDCTQQLQVRENVVGFGRRSEQLKVIKVQIQYRSQSLLNLTRDCFSQNGREGVMGFVSLPHPSRATEAMPG